MLLRQIILQQAQQRSGALWKIQLAAGIFLLAAGALIFAFPILLIYIVAILLMGLGLGLSLSSIETRRVLRGMEHRGEGPQIFFRDPPG